MLANGTGSQPHSGNGTLRADPQGGPRRRIAFAALRSVQGRVTELFKLPWSARVLMPASSVVQSINGYAEKIPVHGHPHVSEHLRVQTRRESAVLDYATAGQSREFSK
jgi:hypothetical protein